MRKSKFTEEQIIKVLREVDAGAKVQDVVRRLGITETTFYRWKSKFGGLEVSDAKRLRDTVRLHGAIGFCLVQRGGFQVGLEVGYVDPSAMLGVRVAWPI